MKNYVFICNRSIEQSLEIHILAEDESEAEALFNAQREETHDFEDRDWANGEPAGPLDWEIDEE